MLLYPDYRWYWLGRLCSIIATWMQLLATTWLLYELTHSALLVGLSGAFQAGPVLGLSIIGGTVADRVNRRSLMLAAQAWTAFLTFITMMLIDLRVITPAEVYILIALSAVADAFSGPASQALFPALVPRQDIGPAVVMDSVLWRAGSLIGPAFAGLIIALSGIVAAFGAAGLIFIFGGIAWFLMRAPIQLAISPSRLFFRDLWGGLTYIRQHRLIGTLLIAEGLSNLMGDNPTMLTLFAAIVLDVGPAGLGLMTSSLGLGAILGIALLSWMGRIREYGKILLVSSLIYILAFIVFGLSRSFLLSIAALLIVGGGDAIWSAARSAILQLVTPDSFRGRVMGLLTLATAGLGPLAGTQSGITAEVLGTPAMPFVTAAATLGLNLWITLVEPELWRFRVSSPTGSHSGEVR